MTKENTESDKTQLWNLERKQRQQTRLPSGMGKEEMPVYSMPVNDRGREETIKTQELRHKAKNLNRLAQFQSFSHLFPVLSGSFSESGSKSAGKRKEEVTQQKPAMQTYTGICAQRASSSPPLLPPPFFQAAL